MNKTGMETVYEVDQSPNPESGVESSWRRPESGVVRPALNVILQTQGENSVGFTKTASVSRVLKATG